LRAFTWRLATALVSVAMVALFVCVGSAEAVGGSWRQITSVPNGFLPGSMLVGLNGNVYIHQDNSGIWYRLKPNNFGSYVKGGWTQLASMPGGYEPLYYASQVLSDGKLLIEGGQYNGSGTEVWTNLGAIYDPVHNMWTPVSPPAGWGTIGDAQSVVRAGGTFMLANIVNGQDALFNEGTLTWTVEPGTGKADRNDEEGYQLLQNARVLTVNDEQALNNPGSPGSQIYAPSTGDWTSAGTIPAVLPSCQSNPCDEELGPMVLRPDGSVFAIGGNSHTAVFQGGTTWAQGPDLPSGYSGDDAQAATLPNGNVLLSVSPGLFQAPTHFWIYNGTTLTQTSDPANAANDPAYVGRMVLLPTGQVMYDDGSGDLEVFTPTGSANTSWAPKFSWSRRTINHGQTYSLSGTRLSGVTTGASNSDSAGANTNYPLVRIKNTRTGRITYARTVTVGTYSVSPRAVSTMKFWVPTTTPSGASTLQVVANGIASAPVKVTIN
jgi:hypothetical protein